MEAFLALVVQYPEIRQIIRRRTIVFGKDSGVSISGQISLYSGEVRNNWLNVIKTTPDSDKLLQSLPMWERTLSQALRGQFSLHFWTSKTFLQMKKKVCR